MVNKLTFIAELKDYVTGPASKAGQSVEGLGKSVEKTGKDADKAYGKAGKAAEDHARRTTQSTAKVERALDDLTGDTRRVGQVWDQTWREAEKGPRRAAEALSNAGTRMEADSRRIGRRVGDNLNSGIQSGIDKIDVSGIATALGGVTVAGGVAGSLSRGTDASRLAAATGDVDADAVRALTEGVYSDGWGRDYESVSMAAGALVATFDIEPGSPEAERLLSGTATLDEVFELGPDQLTMAARIIADNDDISGEAAQDILGAALQGATSAGRDEMLDNLQEYVPLLNDTGISAAALATMLSGATGRGAMASDKTGDAIKEFSVRAIDTGSKPIGEAYGELGLDQLDISRRLQSGDATAFTDVTQALAGVTDQADQARLAIELFGTPIEDLGVGNIDEQIAAWTDLDLTMRDADGTIERMQGTLQDDEGRAWEMALRDLSGAMIDVGDAVAPLISAVSPIISILAKPLAWGATGLTLYGIISRIPGGAAAAKWALSGLWRVVALSPLGRMAALAFGAVKGLEWLYDNVGWVRDGFDSLGDGVRSVLGFFDDLGASIDRLIEDKFPGLHDAAEKAMNFGDGSGAGGSGLSWAERTMGYGAALGESLGLPDVGGNRDARASLLTDDALPHHADGGWTASGAHKAVVGEEGREYILNHYASEKLASVPGALGALSQGRLPTQVAPVPVGGGGGNVTIGELKVYPPTGDGAEFARQFAQQFPHHFQAATARLSRTSDLTYSTLTERGAN